MYVIIGLGNPGNKYYGTRHNVGFAVVEEIARKLNAPIVNSKFKSLIGECKVGDEKVILVKPQTYMNLSGEAVKRIVDYYDVPPENMIVIYDDIDIDTGTIRIRKKGSGGTHNGMKSIILTLGTDEFPRVRVGIGSQRGSIPLADYVLMRFTSDESEEITDSVFYSRDAVISIIKNGIENAMNEFNKKTAAADV